jgi:hypothetical protein
LGTRHFVGCVETGTRRAKEAEMKEKEFRQEEEVGSEKCDSMTLPGRDDNSKDNRLAKAV